LATLPTDGAGFAEPLLVAAARPSGVMARSMVFVWAELILGVRV
jgi:hypothetical protein